MAEEIGGYNPGTNSDVAAIDGAAIGIMSDGSLQNIGAYTSAGYSTGWGVAFSMTGLVVAALAPGAIPLDVIMQMMELRAIIDDRSTPQTTREVAQMTLDTLQAAWGGGGGGIGAFDVTTGVNDPIDNIVDGQAYNPSDVPGALYAKFVANLLPNFAVTLGYGSRGVPTLASLQASGGKIYPIVPYADPNAVVLPADADGVHGVFGYGPSQIDRSSVTNFTTMTTTVSGTGKVKRLIPISLFGSGFSGVLNPYTNPVAVSVTSMVAYPGGLKWKVDGLYASNGLKIPVSPGGSPLGDGTGATVKFAADGISAFGTRFSPVFVPSGIYQGFLASGVSDPTNGVLPGIDLRESVWKYVVGMNVLKAGQPAVSFYLPALPFYSGSNSTVDSAVVNRIDYVQQGQTGGQAEGPGW